MDRAKPSRREGGHRFGVDTVTELLLPRAGCCSLHRTERPALLRVGERREEGSIVGESQQGRLFRVCDIRLLKDPAVARNRRIERIPVGMAVGKFGCTRHCRLVEERAIGQHPVEDQQHHGEDQEERPPCSADPPGY